MKNKSKSHVVYIKNNKDENTQGMFRLIYGKEFEVIGEERLTGLKIRSLLRNSKEIRYLGHDDIYGTGEEFMTFIILE